LVLKSLPGFSPYLDISCSNQDDLSSWLLSENPRMKQFCIGSLQAMHVYPYPESAINQAVM
jgi:hypothetical protein